MNIKVFSKQIQNVIDTPISLGNQILYEICRNQGKYLWGNGDFIGDKIWLIGRSYAASPERRYQKDKVVEDKLELDSRGDGTGQYFTEIGNYIVNDAQYQPLTSKLISLQTSYKFDGSQSDMFLLEETVNAVAKLNDLVMRASNEYDLKYNPNINGKVKYRNQISFCSKFLHFHYPHTVFIMDHFTQKTAIQLFSMRSQKVLRIEDEKIPACLKQELQNYIPCTKLSFSKEVECYAEHCKRSYALCCYIKHSNLFNISNVVYYPRTVDGILQAVKS